MRVLWIVNVVLPPLAQRLNIKTGNSGTWMFDIAEMLDQDPEVQLAVACIHGSVFLREEIGNSVYYCLPGTGRDMMFYNPGLRTYWEKIVADFQPEIVNIHGTEYCHALSFVRTFPDIKTVISLQGMMSKIMRYDFGGLTLRQLICNRTLSECLHCNGMLEYRVFHRKNAKSEQEMLRSVKYCMVVDDWHRSVAKEINPHIRCFEVHYNLRQEFYSAPKWDIQRIQRFTITTNPGGTALKGLHQLFKAVAIVRRSYPQVKVLVPGMTADENGLIVNCGYAKYLKKLINELGISDNIVFLGPQTAEQMVANMLAAHVQVIPSSIEGPSLVLHEGMHLGVPSIASFRGGMAAFVDDRVNGFLYDFGEYQYLAMRIMEIFSSDELAVLLSRKAIEKCQENHNRIANFLGYMDMYKEIMNS